MRDSSDEATLRALAELESLGSLRSAASIRSLDVSNGDLSASRNNGIAASDGRYVGVLDADNLPSENWIAAATQRLQTHSAPAIAHPELIVTFGAKREVWPLMATTDPAFQPGWLAWFNPWDAFVLASREVFERFPYSASNPGGGFGPEDWAWNCDTVAAGIPHIVVGQTTLFYHATDHGLAAAHGNSLLPRNELLSSPDVARRSLERIPHPHEAGHAGHSSLIRRAYRKGRRAVARVVQGIRPASAATEAASPVSTQLLARREEWVAMHKLQPAIPAPTDDTLRGYSTWGTRWDEEFLPEQRAYWQAIAALPPQIDVLVIAPWMRTGGADALTAQYVASIRRLRPHASITLITTEPGGSTKLDLIDSHVTVFDLGMFHLLPQFAVRVLGTIIAQLRPGTVHVVNSTLGYDVIDRYGYALRQHSELFASTFVLDVLPDGTTWSFLQHRSPDFYDKASAVLTDNEAIVRHFAVAEGAPESAFVVHHAVVSEDFRAEPNSAPQPAGRLRVAWAGRFDKQKRLDRYAAIVAACTALPVDFHAYGEPVVGDDSSLTEALEQLNNLGVRVAPPYTAGFATVAKDADVLILTSDREGVPNTVLEAMSSGVIVIAPSVGDISRVITPDTGYLVENPADIRSYVDAIEQILADPKSAERRRRNARALVEAEYGSTSLDQTLLDLPGYLPRATGGKNPAFWWFTDDTTAELLAGSEPRVLVYTGSNGHSNFGDILQNKNILRYWNDRGDRIPVLFLPSFAATSPERIDALRRWLDCRHIVFFSPRRAESPRGTSRVQPGAIDAPLHVVGGGYLNARWGASHFDAIDAIASQFAAPEIVFSGLQVDDHTRARFTEITQHHRVPVIGTRDHKSLSLISRWFPEQAVDTFDDLTEVLLDWTRNVPTSDTDGGLRVAIHMNTSDYAGGDDALRTWTTALRTIANMQPAEVYVLSAYADERPEVRDTLGTVAAMAEQFPFMQFTVIDTALGALNWSPGAPLPSALHPLTTATFAVSSSYHTALMMTMLGVPTYLMGANPYFAQKADIFKLPPFEDFLADPARSVPDLTVQFGRRQKWANTLDTMWRPEAGPTPGDSAR